MSACKAYLISLWLPTMGADSRVWQPLQVPTCSTCSIAPLLRIYIYDLATAQWYMHHLWSPAQAHQRKLHPRFSLVFTLQTKGYSFKKLPIYLWWLTIGMYIVQLCVWGKTQVADEKKTAFSAIIRFWSTESEYTNGSSVYGTTRFGWAYVEHIVSIWADWVQLGLWKSDVSSPLGVERGWCRNLVTRSSSVTSHCPAIQRALAAQRPLNALNRNGIEHFCGQC